MIFRVPEYSESQRRSGSALGSVGVDLGILNQLREAAKVSAASYLAQLGSAVARFVLVPVLDYKTCHGAKESPRGVS